MSITSPSWSQASSIWWIAGHVGHRAAGGQVGQDHADALAAALGELLGAVGEDVGRLGHEVDAAERDVAAVAALGRHLAELIAVAGEVGEGDHFVLLIVVAEDQQLRPQLVADGLDARVQLVVRERLVGLQFEMGGVEWLQS